MDKSTIKAILTGELGYSDYEAEVTAQDLCALQPFLQAALSEWVSTRAQTDVEFEGFSALQLVSKKGFTYPAALIALDWLAVDPETARASLSSDIKP